MPSQSRAGIRRSAVRWAAVGWCVVVILLPQSVFAWGIHGLLTKVALGLLSPWQRTLIQVEEKPMIQRYCIFPDDAQAKDAAPYIVKFPSEAKISLHIPASLEQNKMVFDAYLPRVVSLLRAGNTTEAMRYFGCIVHFLEDSACPCHMAYGTASVPEGAPPLLQMDFFKRFLPTSDKVDQEMLHSRIDGCGMTEEQLVRAVGAYQPRLLGHSVEELTFQLLEEQMRMNQRSSKRVFPMLQALSTDNESEFIAQGAAAAADGTRLVADALHTVLCIAQQRFDSPLPTEASLADRLPARATAFSWSDANHSGQLLRNASGAVFSNKSDPPKLGRCPLKLKMADGSVRQFALGFGVGGRTEYTFLLPKGQFKTFTVHAGNDAELSGEVNTSFEIALDGKPATATSKMTGAQPSQRLEVPLGDAETITLRCKAEGPLNRTHGVWAEPKLVR